MNGEKRALALDAQDELAGFRERFYLPPDSIYLDGNSLGLPCREAEGALLQVLDEWKRLAIGGFLQGETPWISLGERLGELQAPLVGAHPDEVVATASTTVNLVSRATTSANHPSDLLTVAPMLETFERHDGAHTACWDAIRSHERLRMPRTHSLYSNENRRLTSV